MTIPPRAKSSIPLDRKNEVLILVLSGFWIMFLETKKFELKVTQCFITSREEKFMILKGF